MKKIKHVGREVEVWGKRKTYYNLETVLHFHRKPFKGNHCIPYHLIGSIWKELPRYGRRKVEI